MNHRDRLVVFSDLHVGNRRRGDDFVKNADLFMRVLEQYYLSRGYTLVLDEAKMGFPISVFVSVKLDHQIDDRLRSFEDAIRKFPEVTDCWLMTGDRDYLVRVAVADLHEFEHFLTGKLTKVQGVASLESSLPIRRVKENSARLV